MSTGLQCDCAAARERLKDLGPYKGATCEICGERLFTVPRFPAPGGSMAASGPVKASAIKARWFAEMDTASAEMDAALEMEHSR